MMLIKDLMKPLLNYCTEWHKKHTDKREQEEKADNPKDLKIHEGRGLLTSREGI